MRERGMIFNAEMVRAVLDGRKTQTRRIIAPQPELTERSGFKWKGALFGSGSDDRETNRNFAHVKCPFGQPGDSLWVRETWADVNHEGCSAVAYRADGEVRDLSEDEVDDPKVEKYWFANWYPDLISGTEGRWTPSIHMPRWASRITLEITGVRVERLRDLSEHDARSEGVPLAGGVLRGWEHRISFRDLWMSIYGADKWNANPFVWVIEFQRIGGDYE